MDSGRGVFYRSLLSSVSKSSVVQESGGDANISAQDGDVVFACSEQSIDYFPSNHQRKRKSYVRCI